MPDRENFPAIFAQLKAIIEPLASGRLVQADTPDNYVVGAHPSAKIPQYPQGIYLAGVHIKKNYVSYYLMPVYAHPELLEGISEPLKRRMQGKSCFNFTKIDEPILDELARLTTISVECFQRDL